MPWVVMGLTLAALWFLSPLLIPLLLATWFAALAGPVAAWLSARTGGRQHAAALMTIVLFVGLLIPLVYLAVSLAGSGLVLVQRSLHTGSVREAVTVLVGPDGAGSSGLSMTEQVVAFGREHGADTMAVLAALGAVGGWAIISGFVFFLSSYVFLLEGRRVFAWLVLHSPLSRRTMSRLGGAVIETGRGMATGVGLTGLTQGILTSIAYTALGVPRPLMLGMLTCMFAMVPVLGTPMIWVPVTIGLALTGHTTKALVLAGLGSSVMFFVDNVIGPWYARFGRLQMPTWVLILSMFGGVGAMGPWGVLLGPLCVRLASEGLAIARERGLVGPSRPGAGARSTRTPSEGPSSLRVSRRRVSSLLGHPGQVR